MHPHCYHSTENNGEHEIIECSEDLHPYTVETNHPDIRDRIVYPEKKQPWH